jgi:hypothetical protein
VAGNRAVWFSYRERRYATEVSVPRSHQRRRWRGDTNAPCGRASTRARRDS